MAAVFAFRLCTVSVLLAVQRQPQLSVASQSEEYGNVWKKVNNAANGSVTSVSIDYASSAARIIDQPNIDGDNRS